MKRSFAILALILVCSGFLTLIGCGQEESKTLPAVPGGDKPGAASTNKKGAPAMPGP